MNQSGYENLINSLFSENDNIDIQSHQEKCFPMIEFFANLSNEMIWIMDSQFNFTFISQSVEKLLGYNADEMKKSRLIRIMSRKTYHIVEKIRINLEKQSSDMNDFPHKQIFEQMTKDGRKIWIEVVFHPFYKNKEFIGLIGVLKDVTDQINIEQELSRNRNKYFTFFESSPVALWEADYSLIKIYLTTIKYYTYQSVESFFEHNPEELDNCLKLLKIHEVNHSALKAYLVKDQQEFTEWMGLLNTHESKKLFIKMLNAIDLNQLSFSAEGIHTKTNDEQMNIVLFWNVVPGYEELYSKVIVSILDITESKKAEDNILRAQAKLKKINRRLKKSIENEKMLTMEAKIANESKNRFLSTMSHEIRTPLNGILGMSQLLRETLLDKSQKEFLEIIMKSSEMLVSIVNDIFDYSKTESESLELNKGEFQLYELISSCVKSQALKAYNKGLDINLIWNFNTPNLVVGDTHRIKQICLKIIDNAIKFTNQGEIIFKGFMPSKIVENHYLFNFSVQDTGIGIDKDHLERIFHPFYQEDSSSQRKYSGTGLGLSIVYQLVQLMNGTISVNSEKNQGSTFHFSIPLDVKDKSPIIKKIELTKKILLIDDSPRHIEMLTDFFSYSSCLIEYKHPDSMGMVLDSMTQLDTQYDYIIMNRHHLDQFIIENMDFSEYKYSLTKCRLLMLQRPSDHKIFKISIDLSIFATLTCPLDLLELYEIIQL